MSIQNVLVVDDEPDICELLTITLNRMGLETLIAGSVTAALAHLNQHRFDLCLTDMRLPDGSGLDIVSHIQTHFPDLPVAVITAYGSIETAVESLKAGAFDFVSKPVDLKILRRLVTAALDLSNTPQHPEPRTPTSKLIGDSEPMQQLRQLITKLARSQAPVYIHGESGVGKELVAREIHLAGPRESKPFVAVNCGAIPSDLMESEFFGHKKGSFTGAVCDKKGLFQSAHGGTLFLDEVADLPLSMQVKLLRVIQERAVKPIGEPLEQPVDVRILSATHKNLDQEVNHGRFRQDLFYRLNVIELTVPPLRQRKQDIPVLATHILAQLSERWHTQPKTLSQQALAALLNYPYPGNVRELENILERSATLCDNPEIVPDDLTFPEPDNSGDSRPIQKPTPQPLTIDLAQQEKQAILDALEQTRWNKTASAKILGMTLRQLRYRLKKFKIE